LVEAAGLVEISDLDGHQARDAATDEAFCGRPGALIEADAPRLPFRWTFLVCRTGAGVNMAVEAFTRDTAPLPA
jgi:hypothetical protein